MAAAAGRALTVIRLLLVVALWVVPNGAHGQADGVWKDVARVVAVGDVHGAYAPLVELLRGTGLIDADLSWRGADAHLVSLGDLLDRGADGRRVIDLLMRLQGEAAAAGGRVHVVLGNHELMNLIGDLRYVSEGDYAAFRDEEPPAARAEAWAAFATDAPDADPEALRSAFDEAFPPGYFGRQAAFAPDGRYGSWLLGLPAIVVINATAYVHGGLPAMVVDAALGINDQLRARLRRYLELRDVLIAQELLPARDRQHDVQLARQAAATAPPAIAGQIEEYVSLAEASELSLDGPLWYRGSIYCKPLLEAPTLQAALDALGASRVVVGHTPTPDRRVRALYDGRLIALDTGMLMAYYRGRPAALVIEGGAPQVYYLHPAERLAMDSGYPVAYRRTEGQLRAALAQGAIVAVEGDGSMVPWRVMVRHQDVELQAWFYPRRPGRAGDLELAAAGLDDLLGTGLVPPTVPRTIEGQPGALQLRHPDAISETERLERGLGFSGWCPIEPQLQLLYAFDLLTLNAGRSVDNVEYVNDLTDLTSVGHGRAFSTRRALPPGFDVSTIRMPPLLAARLRDLDREQLQAALGSWLDSRQIRALLARRDQLLRGAAL